MPNDDDEVDFDEAVATAVAAAMKKQTDEAERARNRRKEPKDFGEFADRIKDSVKEAFAEMVAERDAPAKDDDEPPARTKRSKSGFAAWWNGEAGDDDA